MRKHRLAAGSEKNAGGVYMDTAQAFRFDVSVHRATSRETSFCFLPVRKMRMCHSVESEHQGKQPTPIFELMAVWRRHQLKTNGLGSQAFVSREAVLFRLFFTIEREIFSLFFCQWLLLVEIEPENILHPETVEKGFK